MATLLRGGLLRDAQALETLRDEVEAAVQLGLTPAELRLYQEWKKAGSPDPAEVRSDAVCERIGVASSSWKPA